MRLLGLALFTVLICGCGFKTPPPTPEELRVKISASCINQNDDYTNTKSALLDYQFSPEGIDPIFGAPATAKLIAKESATSPYAILISYNADNWDFLDKAYEKGGKQLKIVNIDKNVDKKSTALDQASIPLSRDLVFNYSVSGLDFKVSARLGEAAFVIPGYAFEELQTCARLSGIN